MANEDQSLRRRAACAVLSPLLDEEELLSALHLQHETMRGDGVADIIRYIDQVAARHAIDPASRKKLYEGFYKALRLPEDQLPMDPWPMMQPEPVAVTTVAPPPPAAPPAPVAPPPPVSIQPVAAALRAAAAAAPEPVAASPVEASPLPPEQAVCADLIRQVLAEVQRFHAASMQDLSDSALDLVADLRVAPSLKRTLRDLWSRPLQTHWVLDLPVNELAQVVHLLYMALCEALGPVDADQVLTRAVKTAEQGPQARQFSPRRLL